LLTVAEVRKITGQTGYADAEASDPSDGVAGGGTACRYEAGVFAPPPTPAPVDLVLIKGKNYTQLQRTMKLPPGACQRETIKGIGEDAFFWFCTSPKEYRSPLYVKKGVYDLIVQVQRTPPATDASVRAATIALAKAAAAKLR
jgi:hypothetical protein